MQAELEQTYPRLGTIYSLCSVYYPNIRQRSDVLNRWNFLKTGFYEGIIIGTFLKRYETVLIDVLVFAFNAPLLVLNTLNYFPIEKLHTRELLKHDLDGIAAWRSCRDELERLGARIQATTK